MGNRMYDESHTSCCKTDFPIQDMTSFTNTSKKIVKMRVMAKLSGPAN